MISIVISQILKKYIEKIRQFNEELKNKFDGIIPMRLNLRIISLGTSSNVKSAITRIFFLASANSLS